MVSVLARGNIRAPQLQELPIKKARIGILHSFRFTGTKPTLAQRERKSTSRRRPRERSGGEQLTSANNQ